VCVAANLPQKLVIPSLLDPQAQSLALARRLRLLNLIAVGTWRNFLSGFCFPLLVLHGSDEIPPTRDESTI
jgi:hypothetical protein